MASRAKSKEKQIARLEKVAVEEPVTIEARQFQVSSDAAFRTQVITLEHVRQSYGEHVVYRDLNFAANADSEWCSSARTARAIHFFKNPRRCRSIQGGVRELGSNVVTAILRRTASIISAQMRRL